MFLLERHEGLGTYWWITLYEKITERTRTALYEKLTAKVSRFEQDYSRFLPGSLLSELNRRRHLEHVPDDMIRMIQLGNMVSATTGGMFTLGIGKVLESAGYDKDYTLAQKKTVGAASVRAVVTGRDISLKGEGNIDLGGIGKGYLIQAIADYLKKEGLRYFMINGGGDIFASSDNGRPVTVYLQHPYSEEIIFADVRLKNASVCVSSPAKRMWKDGKPGRSYSHIVNPVHPGQDPSAFSGSVVIGNSTAIADALATAFCVMSEDECNRAAGIFNVTYRKIYPLSK